MKWKLAIENIIPQLLVINVLNPAVVFDIDGTLISLSGRRIEEVYHLYEYCKLKGYTIFVITARLELPAVRKITELLLQNCHIQYKLLFMKPALLLEDGFYKSEIRRAIQDKGYNIILNVGDQNSDHVGFLATIECLGK